MMKWVDALKLVGPIVLSTIPAAQPFVPFILKGIEVANELTASGADKKEAAKNIVALGAQVTNQIKGKEVLNPDEAKQVAHDVIDLVVSATNNLHQQMNAPTMSDSQK